MNAAIPVDFGRLRHAALAAERSVNAGAHPTALLAVANRQRTLWTHLVPGADAVREDAIFLLASITKPVLATALIQLVEEGRLLLQRPAAEVLPELTGAHAAITPWHLLTHSSGIDEAQWSNGRMSGDPSLGTCFEEACRAPLLFAPGTRCSYCTLSFAILAELLARIDGVPYPEALRRRIFAPLGMTDTGFVPDWDRAAPVHDMVSPDALRLFAARAIAGGGIWSTAADLVRFGQAMLNADRPAGPRLLSPAFARLMTRHATGSLHQIVEGRETPFDYALGWGKPAANDDLPCGAQAFGHGGATGTLLWIDPQWDLVFVYLTNRWCAEVDTPRRALMSVYSALDRGEQQ